MKTSNSGSGGESGSIVLSTGTSISSSGSLSSGTGLSSSGGGDRSV